MASIRHDSRELHFRIVYFGAAASGKSTNLQYIHRRLDPHLRSDMLKTPDRGRDGLAFDYLPVHATEIAGYRSRFRLEAWEDEGADRRSLENVDGLVFVSDSDPTRVVENVNAHRTLIRSIAGFRRSIPLVYQYNKRDIQSAVRPEVLDEVYGVNSPSFLSCARSGYQVFATLDFLVEQVVSPICASAAAKTRGENVEVAVGSA